MKKIKKIITLIMMSLSLTLFAPELLPMVNSSITTEAAMVKLNIAKATLLKGQTLKLKLSGSQKKITWKSSSKKVAHVSSTGKVTAKSKGKAIISTKLGKKTYKCKITVEDPKLNKSSSTLTNGDKLQLKLTGTTQKVSWKSSDTSIVTVNSKGLVTSKNAGTCTVLATLKDKTYKCAITVNEPVENISPTPVPENVAPTPTPTPTPVPEDTSSTPTLTNVWLSATGTKYHAIPNCGRMNPSTARQITRDKAISYGYSSCDKCF